MIPISRMPLPFLCALAAFAQPATAAVTAVDYYRLGEGDAAAVAGGLGNATTVDSTGNPSGAGALTVNGNPLYSSDIAAAAASNLGSTLSMAFDGAGDYYSASIASILGTNNFGVEGWFKPSGVGTQVMAYTGNSGSSGFGLIIFNGRFQALLGGVTFLDTGVAATLGEWTYFAYVRDNGVNSLYINGTTPIAAGTSAPNPSSQAASIGANPLGGDLYTGLADEVRFFTFNPGDFNAATDLLIAVPEPASSALGMMGILLLALRRRR